jgi:hypothetical protein
MFLVVNHPREIWTSSFSPSEKCDSGQIYTAIDERDQEETSLSLLPVTLSLSLTTPAL